MKKMILLLVLLFGVVIGWMAQRPASQKTQTQSQLASPNGNVLAGPGKEKKDLVTTIDQVDQQLHSKQEALLDIEHELNRAGFPQVLLDERLNEKERAEIIEKIKKASALQNQIAVLRIQKIDMRAGQDL